MRYFLYVTLAWVLLVNPVWGQARLNLGLEPGLNHSQPLVLWSRGTPPGGRVELDSTGARQGRGCLRFELPTPDDGDAPRWASFATGLLPLDSVRGQLLTISAWVRTQGWHGQLILRAGATALTVAGLTSENAQAVDSLPGTTAWRRLEVRLPVKATAFSLDMALRAQGSGRVWLDDIELRVQGRRVAERPVPATGALLLPLAQSLVPNWDFERLPPRLAQPDAAAATVALDSASPQHGRRYLRLARRSPPGQPAPSVYLGTVRLPKEENGKTLLVNGFWRRPGAASGPAEPLVFAARLLTTGQLAHGTWWTDTLGLKQAGPAPGPQWTAFHFEVPVQLRIYGHEEPTDLGGLTLGLLLPDANVLELDNLSFSLDGKPYLPTGPPVPPPPSAAETAWLRTALRPLRLDAPATEAPDLAALGTVLATAQVVGLGEVTHGSHEIFVLHSKLTRYLIGQKGFTGLALEASPLPCEALNDYLRTGQGNPARLLAALPGWHTPDMLGLVGWLRAYHIAHPAAPLLLAGLDVQQPEQALAAFTRLQDPADDFAQSRLRQVAQLLATYPHPAPDDPDLRRHPDQPQDSLLAPLHRLLAELTTGLDTRARLRRPVSLAQLARQRYYLRLVEQGATWRRLSFELAFNYRQACLAENAQYLSQTEGAAGSPARLVLWASNSAVAKSLSLSERPMGEWLRATLGPGYAALGLALGQGSYAALGPLGKWAPTPLAPPPPGAYETWLRTGPAAFWLAPGRAELMEENAWLFEAQLLREVGYRAAHNEFMLHSLHGEFDAVVFWRDSTPATFLP